MGESFKFRSCFEPQPQRRKVLVTGASGNIGSFFSKHTSDRYDLRLMVREESEVQEVASFGEVVAGELDETERLREFCREIDTVVHLAADPSPEATWTSLLSSNIEGTYNLLIAAKAAGCRRVIYASSIHAVSGYPSDVQVKPTDPVNPGDLYGVSKCFGEALCRYMAEQEGLSTIVLRIGGFQPRDYAKDPKSLQMMDAWVSRRDLTQLICRCIDDEELQFAIFSGLSDNRFKRMDITSARELVGYQPEDDLTELNEELKNLDLDDTVMAHSLADGGKSGIRADLR